MRAVLTSVMAFFLAVLVGGVVAQALAVSTHAGEEYILAFVAIIPVAVLVTLAFLIAQLAAGSRRAAGIVAVVLLALVALSAIALLAMSWFASPRTAPVSEEFGIVAGLILPATAMVLAQWLVVRWRAQPQS